LTTVPIQVAQNRVWPQGTCATPSHCNTSQQLSAGPGVAGDVEVIAVAAAGDDAAAAGWSSASSSSLGRTGEETGYKSQSLVGAAPAYLADDCRLLSDVGRRPLRSNSNDMRKLLVPRTRNKLGDRSFSAAGPRLWNDLAPGLRRPGLKLRLLQTISENSVIWRPKRLVTLLNG